MKRPAIEGGPRVRSRLLPFSPPDIGEEEVRAVSDVLRSGWITTGPLCTGFEQALTAYTGASHGVLLSSATAGLYLCLLINGIGAGDEVITTPYTFAATANVIAHTGATPVFADVDEDTLNIAPSEIERKITSRTRAVIPVHFAGHPAPMDAINEIAGANDLLVVEDAAHALGASYQDKNIGTGDNPTVFSFHAVKNLTTAEGGAVLTNDEHLARQLRLYALHGQTRDAYAKQKSGGWRYDITVPGYKYNMTDIQAALGLEQLKKMKRNQMRRKAISARYDETLSSFDFVTTPVTRRDAVHAHHLYPLRIDFSRLSVDRDRFLEAMEAENVSVNVHYRPVHAMSYYRDTFGYEPYDFPAAYSNFIREVSLPLYPQMSDQDVHDVLEAVTTLLEHYRS